MFKLTICARAIFERRRTTDELKRQYAESRNTFSPPLQNVLRLCGYFHGDKRIFFMVGFAGTKRRTVQETLEIPAFFREVQLQIYRPDGRCIDLWKALNKPENILLGVNSELKIDGVHILLEIGE